MVATRGPVPKHSSQRRRRNDTGTETVVASSAAAMPPIPDHLGDLAQEWLRSLGDSAQSRFYEPSDWMAAIVLAEALDEWTRNPTAAMLSTIMSGWQVLLVTEGDRRRMRVELERRESEAEVTSVVDYRARLA